MPRLVPGPQQLAKGALHPAGRHRDLGVGDRARHGHVPQRARRRRQSPAAPLPLAFLLGGIACLALAFVVIGFTRRMAVGRATPTPTPAAASASRPGFMAGWLYSFGLICFVPDDDGRGRPTWSPTCSGWTSSWWFLLFLIGMVLLVVLSIVRIKVTTRLQMLVGRVTVARDRHRRPGHHRQGRRARQLGGAVHASRTRSRAASTASSTASSSASRPHRLRDRRRLRRGDGEPAAGHPDRGHRATAFAILFYLLATYAMTIGFGVDNGRLRLGRGSLLEDHCRHATSAALVPAR